MYTDIEQAYRDQIVEAQQLVRDGTLLSARVIMHGRLITMEFVAPIPEEELTLGERESLWGSDCEDD